MKTARCEGWIKGSLERLWSRFETGHPSLPPSLRRAGSPQLDLSPSPCTDLPSPPPFNNAWALVIILGRWRRGQPVKGAGVTPKERMVGMTEKKKQIREKIKSRSSPFTRLKALKRIRSDRARGLLSSLAIRLSWWREWREWQGSRPSLGLTQQGGVFPRRLLYLPLHSECQKCSWNISWRRQHNPRCQTLITVVDEIGEGVLFEREREK